MSATALAAPTADALARAHPEFRGWLDILALTGEEATCSVWTDAVPDNLPMRAPRLAGATLEIDADAVAAWLARLLGCASAAVGALAGVAARLEPLAALQAAIALDGARLDALADAAGAPREALRGVLPLAAYPWLQACGARLDAPEPRGAWCPICGAWASLAEARGLQGARRLRCGRCGGDWGTAWLACPFCGVEEHTRLRGLVDETSGATRRADGCAACGAWVKSVPTLAAPAVGELRLLDLATVGLDVAALERGWRRPGGLGAPLDVSVVARRRRWWRR